MTSLEEKYFTILKDYFGEALKIAAKQRFNGEKYIPMLRRLYDPDTARSIMHSLSDELSALDWATQEVLVKKMGGLKVAYVGSRFSYLEHASSTSDFLRKTCLYSDTVILNENILTTASSGPEGVEMPPCLFAGTVEEAINFLAIEHLFSSDSHICTLAPPPKWCFKEETNRLLSELETKELLAFASDYFGKEIASTKQLQRFVLKIKNNRQFLALARKPQILTTPTGDPSTSIDLERMQEKLVTADPYHPSDLLYLHFLKMHCYGLARDLFRYGGYKPILATDLAGIWKRLIWLIKNDNEQVLSAQDRKQFTKEELIVSALQQEELKWLGNVPLNKLEELRTRGELGELRSLIGRNVENIENVSDADFVEVGRQVKHNIETAMKKHDAQIKDLDEQYRKRYKIDLGSITVSGTLGLVSTVFPPIALISALIGAPSIYRIVEDYLAKREKDQELRKKPVAMLFDAKKVSS